MPASAKRSNKRLARAPLDWAATQMNLGNALEALGARGSGTARLNEAVAAYREALQELTRERARLDWARTQSNLGIALRMLGEQEGDTARLDEAVAAYREALQNLAMVYIAFFLKDHQPSRLDAALEAVDGALEEFRKAKAAFYVERAERVRQAILAARRGVRHG